MKIDDSEQGVYRLTATRTCDEPMEVWEAIEDALFHADEAGKPPAYPAEVTVTIEVAPNE